MTTPSVTVPVEPEGVSPVYSAAYDSIRKGAPGLSDATCAVIARSINMKLSRLSAAPAPEGVAVDGPEDDELPGDFLARVGMDGALWADGFRKMALKLGYSDMDEGWLIGWFCNAVMAGYDHAQRRFDPALATREEAPAEAGKAARIIACHLPLADAPDTVCLPITMTAGDLRTVYAALRAQPPARSEEAGNYRVGEFIGRQPVLCPHGSTDPNNLCAYCEGDEVWPGRAHPQAREDAQPVGMIDGEAVALPSIAVDGPHRPCEHRLWLARQLLDSRMSDAEAYSTIAFSPAITDLHPAPDALREAVSDIAAERQRQVDAEGWSADRDDGYADAELAKSAAAYTLSACGFSPDAAREMWPRSWSAHWWKPTTARRDLVKAGALIVAEIERLDRQALAALQAEQKGGA